MSKIICFILIFLLFLGFGLGAVAQTSGASGSFQGSGASGSWAGGSWIELENPLKANTFAGLFAGIMDWILSIIGLIAVGMIVYGGFQYMLSGGVEAKTMEAKNTIRNAIIGLVLVVLSYAFLAAIKEILGITMIKMFIA
jgi:hypothetical protein